MPEVGPFLTSASDESRGRANLLPAFGLPPAHQTHRDALALIAVILALPALLVAAYDIWLTVYVGPAAMSTTLDPPLAWPLSVAGVFLTPVGLLCAMAALVCGILALWFTRRYMRLYRRRWMAITAIVLASVSAILLLLWIVLSVLVILAVGAQYLG